MNEPNPTAAILLYVLGGLAGAVFYLPFKKVKSWAWESYWLVYAVAGLVVVPWALAFIVSPKVCGLLSNADLKMLALCFLFGAMWGFGGLTWGLMIRYLGVGLGLAVGCGLCASAGTLIPPLFKGELGGFLRVGSGQATLVGVAVALVGIVMVGLAGMSKERELPEEEKKKAVAEFDFKKGMLVAIFSGVMSAGMAFGLASGGALESAAVAAGTSPTWKGIPVLVVVLLGGFTVNLLWCLYLNFKNKTAGDYTRKDAPLAANVIFAGLAGFIWCLQFITYKVADSKIGELGFAGWTVFMSSMIIFSTLLGIALGEWKGVSSRTRTLLGVSLAVLVASLLIIGYGNKLKAGEAKTPARAATPAAAATYARFHPGPVTRSLQLVANQRSVAQASKPAVSPISKSAGGRNLLAPRRLETCDTADLEICATTLSIPVRFHPGAPVRPLPPAPRPSTLGTPHHAFPGPPV